MNVSVWTITKGSEIIKLRHDETLPVKAMRFVTHADYRAIEDENRSIRASFDEAHQLWVKAYEELASIKARVGELVGAAENTLAVEKRYGLGGSASDRLSSAVRALK